MTTVITLWDTLLHRMLWVERLPVPERSGMKGAIIMLSLMWFVLSPLPGGGKDSALGAVVCELMPWKCLGAGHDSEYTEYRHGAPHYVWISNIHIGVSSSKRRPVCTCHLDLTRPDRSRTILHEVLETSVTCDSYKEVTTFWFAPDNLYTGVNVIANRYYWYHCTDDPKYTSMGRWFGDKRVDYNWQWPGGPEIISEHSWIIRRIPTP